MRWCTPFAIAAMGAMTAAPQTPGTLAGKVVGRDGGPAIGVEVAPFWLGGVGGPTGFRPYGGDTTGAQGTFQIRAAQPRFPAALFAIHSTECRGAIIAVPDAAHAGELMLRLLPLRQVRYEFRSPGLKDLSQARITLQLRSGPVFSQITGALAGTILLPPGAFTLSISAAGGSQTSIDFAVAEADLVLDPIPLPNNIGQYYGRTPPRLAGLQQVNGGPFAPDGLRGKWVVLYFWGYWCAPCINEGLPKLKEFYIREHAHRDRFEVLAIHENGVAGTISADELSRKLEALAKDKWSGEPLPFPVLLDRTGDLIRNWGISAYPTVALLSPEGVLMQGDLETLDRMLKRQ
jgi:thiol-disulfide isomerase/thioredoxin